MYHPEVEWVPHAGPDVGTVYRGYDGLRLGISEWLRDFDDFSIEAQRFIDAGDDRVVVLTRHRARGKRSGVIVEREGAELFTMRDGRIVRQDSFQDRAAALATAGLQQGLRHAHEQG